MRVLAACLFLAVMAGAAQAQSSLGIGNAEVAIQPGSGPFSGLFLWIASVQREFFTMLRHALVALRQGHGGFLALITLSFAYGIFHAAGPGHGKAVISAYMLANTVQLRRGIALSFAAAFLQAIVALVVVAAGWLLLRGASLSMSGLGWYLELASYGLIILFGCGLLARKLWRFWQARGSAQLAFGSAGEFSGASAAKAGSSFSADAVEPGVCVAPEADCACGRMHMPEPAQLTAPGFGLRSGLTAVLAVGMRPCAGAIVVLTFATVNGMWLGGALSVFAMALGTAITVSALATLAVLFRDTALKFGGKSGWLQGALEVSGALLLIVLGVALLGGALQMQVPA
ncbi:nickel/cobalt transporter [Aureimonas fodinaquatilis]|nr:nickel/cobalt transporter [Aureimonas fodinaquatilis]